MTRLSAAYTDELSVVKRSLPTSRFPLVSAVTTSSYAPSASLRVSNGRAESEGRPRSNRWCWESKTGQFW